MRLHDTDLRRLALNGAFTIVYTIGNIEQYEDPEELLTSLVLAGLNHVFAAPVEACDNCGRQGEQAHLVTSTSPVTALLLDYVEIGGLESMRPEHVDPFLRKNLKWRAYKVCISDHRPRKDHTS